MKEKIPRVQLTTKTNRNTKPIRFANGLAYDLAVHPSFPNERDDDDDAGPSTRL